MTDRVFTGAIVSISSTTIIFRAFDELGLRAKRFTELVMGVLVLEDLMAVIMLVLLSTLTVSSAAGGTLILFSVLKLAFFLCLWFLCGIYVLPTFLRAVRRFLSDETLLIVALSLCLGMVVLANKVGFSSALGAFIMGSMLADTAKAERIEKLISSVKALFGAIFFVSVGMLIDADLLIRYSLPVLILTLVVAIGKTVNVTIGALIAGTPLKQSVQMGTSMAQIGEFSFIIATLGTSLKVTGNYLYPIAVGVSVITTFTTPYIIRLANPMHKFLEHALPSKWVAALARYSSGSQDTIDENDWHIVIRSYLSIIMLNAIIIIGAVLLSDNYMAPFISSHLENQTIAAIISIVLTFSVSAPFLWAMAARKPNRPSYKNLWLNQKYNQGPLVMIQIFRILIAGVLLSWMITRFVSVSFTFLVVLPVTVVVVIIFNKLLQAFHHRIEERFLNNLNEKEIRRTDHPLSPWDAHMVCFEVPANATFAGSILGNLNWREDYGINIAYIERGEQTIYAPDRYANIFPYDKLSVIGTDEQLEKFKSAISEKETFSEDSRHVIALRRIRVDDRSRLNGKTLQESGIRERTKGLVVGIERDGERMLNPSSQLVFTSGDLVWIVGDKNLIRKYYQ